MDNESIPIKYRNSSLSEDKRWDIYDAFFQRLSPSQRRNLFFRAQLYDMYPIDFYYSPLFQPLERQPYSKEHTLTREEYYRREAERDKAEDERRYEYAKNAAKLRKKRQRKSAEAKQRMDRKRNERLLYDILSYAVSHGWRRDRLHLLLEEGEELPPMFRPESIIPLEAVNSVSS